MGLPRKAPKTSALLVAAIRKLRNIHGSTSREITNYIASEYDKPTKNIKLQMKLALRRGLSAGILHRSKNGHYTCAAVDDLNAPEDRRKRSCGRRRSHRRKRSCRSRRRSRGRKRGCGRRRRRSRRGMKCGRRRGRRSRSRRRRRGGKCRGRRHEDGVELDELAARGTVGKQRPKRTRGGGKSKNSSKTSSQMRVSSASSGETRRSGADTASGTLSASGKESLTDQSDISRNSDVTSGETKP